MRWPLALVLGSVLISPAQAAFFTVSDADLKGGVYELRYYTQRNLLVKNGMGTVLDSTPLDNLFLTNAGNTSYPAYEYYGSDSGVRYLQATGAYGGWGGGVNSTWNTSAAATMGWDFSSLSGPIVKVELLTYQNIGQFPDWNDEALGDKIFADVATPSAFGAAMYTNLYTFTSDNADGTGPGGYAANSVINITGNLSSAWLNDPQKLEVRFGYELVNTDIPGRHLQLFRDNSTTGFPDNSFMLRVTVGSAEVPEPSSLIILMGSVVCSLALAWRRQRA